jgi:hypothetical protein
VQDIEAMGAYAFPGDITEEDNPGILTGDTEMKEIRIGGFHGGGWKGKGGGYSESSEVPGQQSTRQVAPQERPPLSSFKVGGGMPRPNNEVAGEEERVVTPPVPTPEPAPQPKPTAAPKEDVSNTISRAIQLTGGEYDEESNAILVKADNPSYAKQLEVQLNQAGVPVVVEYSEGFAVIKEKPSIESGVQRLLDASKKSPGHAEDRRKKMIEQVTRPRLPIQQ